MNRIQRMTGKLLIALLLTFAGCDDYNDDGSVVSHLAVDIEASKSQVDMYEVVAVGITTRSVGQAQLRWVEWGLWAGPSSDVVFDCTTCANADVDFGYPGIYTLYCTVSWEDVYGNRTLERLYLDFEVSNDVYSPPIITGVN